MEKKVPTEVLVAMLALAALLDLDPEFNNETVADLGEKLTDRWGEADVGDETLRNAVLEFAQGVVDANHG